MIARASRELLEAHEPAELRGHGRDDVRLLVAHRHGSIAHARFAELPELLAPGDLLAINTSATLPAAIPVRGTELRLHLSSPAPGRGDGAWLVELRHAAPTASAAAPRATCSCCPRAGRPFCSSAIRAAGSGSPACACRRRCRTTSPVTASRSATGTRAEEWPLERYQTVYANAPGSAEMPSAGRAFTPELVTQLVAAGIDVAPLVLHTGVSSLEAGETPAR